MKKAHFNALARVFEAEINQALTKGVWLPFQSRAKVFRELAEEGYVQSVFVKLERGFSIQVVGWELTHLGRLSFCAQCDEQEVS